jgi:hypothetical protein
MDQSAKQPIRILIHDSELPWLQLDSTFVLSSGAVLREEARPVFPEGADLHASDALRESHSHRPGRPNQSHGFRAFVDDAWIALIEDYAKLVNTSGVGRYAPIPEVQAEQVAVRLLRHQRPAADWAISISQLQPSPFHHVAALQPPFTHSGARDTGLSADRTIVQTPIDQGPGQSDVCQ